MIYSPHRCEPRSFKRETLEKTALEQAFYICFFSLPHSTLIASPFNSIYDFSSILGIPVVIQRRD